MAGVSARPGDLLGYDTSPGRYYWLIFGKPSSLMALRMDLIGDEFRVNGSAYPTIPAYGAHHVVWRRP